MGAVSLSLSPCFCLSADFIHAQGTSVYAILFQWPGNSQVQLIAPRATAKTTVTVRDPARLQAYWPNTHIYIYIYAYIASSSHMQMLGVKAPLVFTSSGAGLAVTLPSVTPSTVPCDHAWVLRLDGLANANRAD
jgi:hypothetical protein